MKISRRKIAVGSIAALAVTRMPSAAKTMFLRASPLLAEALRAHFRNKPIDRVGGRVGPPLSLGGFARRSHPALVFTLSLRPSAFDIGNDSFDLLVAKRAAEGRHVAFIVYPRIRLEAILGDANENIIWVMQVCPLAS